MIQQYGLQRTGTNAVKALVETNLGLTVNSEGKHHPPVTGMEGPFLVSVKDPVSWVWSQYRFRRMKRADENPPVDVLFDNYFVADALRIWESVTLSFMLLSETHDDILFVQHEDLLANPGGVLDRASITFNENVPDEVELFLSGYAKRARPSVHGDRLIDKDRVFNRDYHLSGVWKEEMPVKQYDVCRNYTDQLFEAYPVLGKIISLEHV